MKNLPIPKHLQSILQPFDNSNENEVTGKIICSCGSEKFKIKIVGNDLFFETEKVIKVQEIEEHFYLIVHIECNNCSKNHLIFDNDFHGHGIDEILCLFAYGKDLTARPNEYKFYLEDQPLNKFNTLYKCLTYESPLSTQYNSHSDLWNHMTNLEYWIPNHHPKK